jgi:predicted metal-dependent hydrolase
MAAENEGIISEVKDFLAGLSLELPLLFPLPRPRPSPRRLPPAPQPAPAAEGRLHKHFPYQGRDLPLTIIEAPGTRRSEIVEDADGLRLLRGDDREAPQAVLREWLVDRAREAFVERAAYWAPRLEVRYERITIRDQRTVWGSCTKAGHLNFNWRIVMAPPEVLDYLVIHELSHLREMNHSRRFWAIVASQCPEWRAHRRWLRDHSHRLKGAVRRAAA